MEPTVSFVEVAKDGVLDYPLFPGQTLGGVWQIQASEFGPAVTPDANFLHYHVTNQQASDQSVMVSIATPLPTAQGSLLVFRVRATTIQGPVVQFILPAGVVLRFEQSGTIANWQAWGGSHALGPSSIRPDGSWHSIVMAFTSDAVTLFEDGEYRFSWQTHVGEQINPVFRMQVLAEGVDLAFDVGDIYAVPPFFAPGINTPWDYSFSAGIWPSPLAMTFDVSDIGPQVSFADGYVRFAAKPQPVPVYRFYVAEPRNSGYRYLYSLNIQPEEGWTYQGIAFYAYQEQVDGSQPIYRFYVAEADGSGYRYLLSIARTPEEGWTYQGIALYAFAQPDGESVPIYRSYAAEADGSGYRYNFSVDPTPEQGWTAQGIAFHACKAKPQPVPVYRFYVAEPRNSGYRYLYSLNRLPEEGWTYQGIAFYAYQEQVDGSQPIYRFYVAEADGSGYRYLLSIARTPEEGWTYQGIALYAFAQPDGESVPIYRSYAAEADGSGYRYNFSVDPTPEQGWTAQGIAFHACKAKPALLSQSLLNVPQNAPPIAIFIYRIRVNSSGGRETKISLPGDNFLRLINNGQSSSWNASDGTSFVVWTPSSIVAGMPDFTLVTLVLSSTSVSLLENGVLQYNYPYPTVRNWNPGLAIEHQDIGTNISIDIGGIRTLPGIKTPELLATDLQNELLAYFPLKSSLENLAGTTGVLVPRGGTPAYINGPFGKAVDFSGQRMVLEIPQLPVATSPSYTLSIWAKVNAYPSADNLAGIAGSLLLDANGHLQYAFIFNNQHVYQEQLFVSAGTLSIGVWHNVVVTYSYEEARLALFLDGKIDNLYYLGSDVASVSAILPAVFDIGGYQANYNQALTVLNGAVGDFFIFTQHVHQPTVAMLANKVATSDELLEARAALLLLPLFLIVVFGVQRVGIEHTILEQTQPVPPPPLNMYVATIRRLVDYPASSGKQVSRFDLHMKSDYKVLLDIGGEGYLNLGGFVTGFQGAINVNAPLTRSDPPIPTVTAPGRYHGAPIPDLVALQPWTTDPGYPFSDNFADEITMIRAPLTPKNIREMARVIRNGGEINLWIDTATYKDATRELARRLNSVVETVPEISAFRNNRAGSTRQNDFKRGASMASDTFWPIHQRIVAKKPAIIFYATEFGDLEPLIKSAGQYASQPYITHVLLGLFHLGYDNEDKTRPYIHLNNKNPDDPGYATLWEKVKIIQRRGVRVMGSLGGYGKRPNEDGVLDYTNFFTSDQTYQTFYQLLRDTLKKYNLDGLDLDIEEIAPWVNTANIRQLVRDLRNDFQGFQRGFLITSAPVASALTGGNNVSPNVDYPQLFEQFDFYLLQFYNSFGQLNPLKDHDSKTRPTYSEVADRYPDKEHKLIAGVLTNPKDGTHGYNLISTLSPILTNLTLSYRGFGGVFGWNYQNAVVDNNVKDPFGWAKSVWTALRMKPVPTTLEGEVEGAKTEE